MKHILKIDADIPNEIIKYLYFPLKETMGLEWNDFNKFLIYMGLFSSIQIWETSLKELKSKGGLQDKNVNEVYVETGMLMLEDFMKTVDKSTRISDTMNNFVDILKNNMK